MNKKKTEKLLKAILDATREELLTTQELCSRFRISTKSLNNWLREDKDFERDYRAAQYEALRSTFSKAASSLLKKIEGGYTIRTEKTTYRYNKEGKQILASKVITEREAEPELQAIALILRNSLPQYIE